MRYIDAEELSKDILEGEIEITGEAADLIQQAVESYRSVILRRIMAQPTEDVIPLRFIERVISETREEMAATKEGSMDNIAFGMMIATWERLIAIWEKVKDEWLHKDLRLHQEK